MRNSSDFEENRCELVAIPKSMSAKKLRFYRPKKTAGARKVAVLGLKLCDIDPQTSGSPECTSVFFVGCEVFIGCEIEFTLSQCSKPHPFWTSNGRIQPDGK